MTTRHCPRNCLGVGLLALGLHTATTTNAAARGDGPEAASIHVDAGHSEGPISPLLYGQFLEYMFGCIKGGLHAELLQDRDFEEPASAIGLPRHWERYPDDRNDGGMRFVWDETTYYPPDRPSDVKPTGPEHALRVEAPGGAERRGLFQPRIAVRKDTTYHGYLWVKAGDFQGRIIAALEPDTDADAATAYTNAVISGIQGDWKQYTFQLESRKADPLARFVLMFEGRGHLWLDQVSLLPGDAVDSVRHDVFERVAALRPGFIRWPGGNVAQDYHWRWGTGPRDRRVTWTNRAWNNEREPSDFGLAEYLRFCRNLGAEPTICVNAEGAGASDEEAANWVEYCNGPVTSKFGAMRAADGHPEPYNVRWWEIGNEVFGDWVRGHSDAATYARTANRYAAAMRNADPTIKLIAVGDNSLDWDRTVLRDAGKSFDVLAIHHYYGGNEMGGDIKNLMARPLFYEEFYREVAHMIETEAPGRPITLAINEWGLSFPPERLYSIDQALYAARLMNVFERSNAIVTMTAVSDLVNGWPGGIIQAGRTGVFVAPTYLVNQLYAEHLGAERLATTVAGPRFDSTRQGKQIPALDAVASRSNDGKSLFIKAVNSDHEGALAVAIRIDGAAIGPQADLATITAESPGAFNHFATPNAISIHRSRIDSGATMNVELPPASVAVLRLHLGAK
jgi:alpha-N-arabinofuranosidase